jgi:hypothetical protein
MHSGDLFPWRRYPLSTWPVAGAGSHIRPSSERAVKAILSVDSVIMRHVATVQRWADFVDYDEFHREFLRTVETARYGRQPESERGGPAS